MLKVNCTNCKKECLKHKCRVKNSKGNLFCSKVCSLKFNSVNGFSKGHKTNIGKKHSEEHKKKIGLAQKGKKMPPRTEEWRKKQSLVQSRPNPNRRGENCPSWKGGVTDINIAVRQSIEYKEWRTSVFKRDGFVCIWCGSKNIQADHIIPLSAIIEKIKFQYGIENLLRNCIESELVMDISNGRTLCVDCHKKTDTYGSKLNKKRYNVIIND